MADDEIVDGMSQDRLDASLDIDRRSSLEIVRIIQEQDAQVARAVAAEAERIAHAIDQITERLSHGGRLFYAGAGTSGRIAMLDASELRRPTHRSVDGARAHRRRRGAFSEASKGGGR